MRGLLIAGILAMTVVAIGAQSMLRDPFEGKWKVKIEPDDEAHRAGERAVDDTLIFHGMKFESSAFRARGFKPVEYEQDTRGITTAKFTASPKSDKEGSAKWAGSVAATEMQGTLVWTKKDGTNLNFIFKGSRE